MNIKINQYKDADLNGDTNISKYSIIRYIRDNKLQIITAHPTI